MSNDLRREIAKKIGKRNLLKARRMTRTARRRSATTLGAVLLGLVALAFARNADQAQEVFAYLYARHPGPMLAAVPFVYAGVAFLTRRFYPLSRGSGIPQVIEASHNPSAPSHAGLVSLGAAAFKYLATLVILMFGGSVGREGPTVQISAAIMTATHRAFGVELSSAVIIAGGAAGVAAAFNTPLAGVAFAIEELAAAYEQRLAVLAMAAVMISGLVSLGLAGDYVYFGEMRETLTLGGALAICPVAGVLGGLTGGLFSRGMLCFGQMNWAPLAAARRRPIVWALLCGALVAGAGWLSDGATWGTGYAVARGVIEGHGQPLWFGPAKALVTLVTALSGVPGGIFAPSLSAGAGFGALIAPWFPSEPLGGVALVGMIGYFAGVVRSPITAVLIVSEMTNSRSMILPLFAAALIGDAVSGLVCKERLYHGLSKAFRPAEGRAERR